MPPPLPEKASNACGTHDNAETRMGTNLPPPPAAREQRPSQEGLQSYWKTHGYAAYCDWVSCSRRFFILRQFRRANVRVLLAMQDEIAELEDQLDCLDKALSAVEVHNGSFRQLGGTVEGDKQLIERHQTVWKLQSKLKDYNEHLSSFCTIADRDSVASYDVESVRSWHDTHNEAIAVEECAYLKKDFDLVYALPPRRRPLLNHLISKLPFFRRYPDGGERGRDEEETGDGRNINGNATDYGPDPNTLLQNKGAADRALRAVTLPFGVFMLVGPLWLLDALPTLRSRLGGITGFVLLLALYLTVGTTSRTEAILGTTAAYAAVLMVFLQVSTADG